MMQTIQSSERFKKEYIDFQERISKVTDGILQQDLTTKLTTLKELVMYLDRQHETLFVSNKLGGDVKETRDEIVSVRKQISESLSNWERAQIKV